MFSNVIVWGILCASIQLLGMKDDIAQPPVPNGLAAEDAKITIETSDKKIIALTREQLNYYVTKVSISKNGEYCLVRMKDMTNVGEVRVIPNDGYLSEYQKIKKFMKNESI